MQPTSSSLADEVAELERRLDEAKAQLAKHAKQSLDNGINPSSATHTSSPVLHSLLLLSDSALPLGSFAFSSGLESFLAHRAKHAHTPATFSRFLSLSLASLASLSLPYVIAGFEEPGRLEELDNDFDASTTCTVARRASVKQGRALVAVWERSFRAQFCTEEEHAAGTPTQAAQAALREFGAAMKVAGDVEREFGEFEPNGHLPPILGTVCAAVGMSLYETLYMYLFNHVKTLVSAGIRASVLGPYQAQTVLAGGGLRGRLDAIIHHELYGSKKRSTDEAGQSVPMLDIWGGRHEIIYSRIFNS